MNEWIARLFSPRNLDETVAFLVGAQGKEDAVDAAERTFLGRIAAAEATMGRLQRALEAGWDPQALTSEYSAVVVEKEAACLRFMAVASGSLAVGSAYLGGEMTPTRHFQW